jgi:hypothetical protein
MQESTIKIHKISEDGLPDMEATNPSLTGRVALIFDGCVVSGYPLDQDRHPGQWEGDTDVSYGRKFLDVTHWIEFPVPVWDLEN